ncbi:purine-binding chemotaxis protein CheW [Methylomonas sp. LL1]|uniref:chemotaxis protein CheW n=1 Tax=Methylomonas sp. LL1 TaxID=2785785 RepID=UPI0018C37291|nr:chemotaxis protein CheW [Methylomonas sp. LL1]QPK64249.1 purine-binding chemotaxis protein CheW [Methylomonas sp. LL1]
MDSKHTELITTEPSEQGQYLIFMLGREMFAMNILVIKEITEVGRLTTVPRMPDFIRGVINLRGGVVPVVDLGARFDKPPAQLTRRTCIIIIEVGDDDDDKQDVGVMVDGVSAVMEIPTSEIKPPPSFGSHIRTDFISAVGKVNDEFVIILNVDYVLAMDEIAALAGVASDGKREENPAQALAA